MILRTKEATRALHNSSGTRHLRHKQMRFQILLYEIEQSALHANRCQFAFSLHPV